VNASQMKEYAHSGRQSDVFSFHGGQSGLALKLG
jgi:hypothetical protein